MLPEVKVTVVDLGQTLIGCPGHQHKGCKERRIVNTFMKLLWEFFFSNSGDSIKKYMTFIQMTDCSGIGWCSLGSRRKDGIR